MSVGRGGNQSWMQLPLQEAALAAAQHKDPVAQRIGAANTLVGQSDGSLAAYNTDWSAAISAIENGLRASTEGVQAATAGSSSDGGSLLKGRTVLVVGAGGAGRALAFGAAEAGAKVHSIITSKPDFQIARSTCLMGCSTRSGMQVRLPCISVLRPAGYVEHDGRWMQPFALSLR